MPAYTDEQATSAQLIARGTHQPPRRALFDGPWWPNPPANWTPPAYYAPAPFVHLFGTTAGDGVAFMHERFTPAGKRRLVVVGVGCGAFGPTGHHVGLVAHAYIPASPWGSSSLQPDDRNSDAFDLQTSPDNRVQFFIGQPSDHDRSRFVISYKLNGQSGSIEGQLEDSADGVSVRLRATNH